MAIILGTCWAAIPWADLPGEGEYGEVVAKAVNWILAQAQPTGLIQYTKQSAQGPAMYGHGLATLMLSEVWGQTRRQDVGNALRKAVQLILEVQGPRGSWGYQSRPMDGDTSVAVIQILALKSAYEAGIHVPESAVSRALKVVKERYNAEKGLFGYSNTHSAGAGHGGSAAAGTTIMHITDEKDPKYTKESRAALVKILKGKKHPGHFFYFIYYGSVSAYFAGDEEYRTWVQIMEPLVLAKQDGSGRFGHGLYHQTSFAILALALPYRYIPIYQH